MRANNPGREIPADRVLGFADINAVNQWLLGNPERTTAVVHFREEQPGGPLGFSLQTNSTVGHLGWVPFLKCSALPCLGGALVFCPEFSCPAALLLDVLLAAPSLMFILDCLSRHELPGLCFLRE